MSVVRGVVGALVVLACLGVAPHVAGAGRPSELADAPGTVSGPTGGGPLVAEGPATEGTQTFSWGVELRARGPQPCHSNTPEPCYGWVWRYVCPIGGVARVTDVTTYMGSEGPGYAAFIMRVRLVRRGQTPGGEPWVEITRPTTFNPKKMVVHNPSDSVPTRKAWDMQVQFEWDRTGRPDAVRTFREPVTFDC